MCCLGERWQGRAGATGGRKAAMPWRRAWGMRDRAAALTQSLDIALIDDAPRSLITALLMLVAGCDFARGAPCPDRPPRCVPPSC